MAIALAQEAVNHPDYNKLSTLEKRYILLPFMHSESLELHDWAYKYFEELGDEEFMYYEIDMSTFSRTYFYRTIYINFHEFVCNYKIIYLVQLRVNKLAIARP